MPNLTQEVDDHNFSSTYNLEVSLLESVALNSTRAGFGRNLAVGIILGSIVLGAILGNILVVLSVCTNRRLRTVTNFYVVSLALSDLCVALLVMPIGIVVEITGTWGFGPIVCELWVSCDVLLCTASILNLCCISLDRYFAITKPLVYATKRSKRLALAMIAVVWVSAVVITCPPIFGWREANRNAEQHCGLTKAPGYIIYSSLGSFYLPLMVMIFAYIRIFIVACRRERRFRPYYHQRSLRYTDPPGGHQMNCSVGSDCQRHPSDRESIELGELASTEANGRDLVIEDTGGKCGNSRRTGGKDGLEGPMCMGNKMKKSQQNSSRGNNGLDGGSSGGGGGGVGGGYGVGHYGPLTCSSNMSSGNSASNATNRTGQCKSGGTTQHANRNAFTNSHARIARCHSDSSHSSGGNQKTSAGAGGNHHVATCGFSRSPSVVSKRCGTYAIATKGERGRERAVLLKEHKAAKTLAVVVGGFIACWLPFFLMYVIEPFCTTCQFNPTLATFFTWLGYFNSVMNPFIYAFYNKDFRHSFWALTCGLVFKDK